MQLLFVHVSNAMERVQHDSNSSEDDEEEVEHDDHEHEPPKGVRFEV